VAALSHPNICALYDVGENFSRTSPSWRPARRLHRHPRPPGQQSGPGAPSGLAMEHIEGEPLAGPLPIDKALAYARQILEALDGAHRKATVHRDLKQAIRRQGMSWELRRSQRRVEGGA
jgi:serine/threonine protein kinase